MIAVLIKRHRRVWRATLSLREWPRVMAGLSAAASVSCLVGYMAGHFSVWWSATEHAGEYASFVSRGVDFTNGVCPTLPVLCLASAVTLWGVTELWRVRSGRVALADAAVHPLLQGMVYADVQTLTAPWALLNQSILTVPRRLGILGGGVCLAACFFVFDPFNGWLVSVEGAWYGRFVAGAMLLIGVMLVLALTQVAFLWHHVKRLLVLMARHDMAAAYSRVPRQVFPSDLFPKAPRLPDLQVAVAQWQRLIGPDTGRLDLGRVPATCANIGTTFEEEMRTDPGSPWATSKTWTALLNAGTHIIGELRNGVVRTSSGPMLHDEELHATARAHATLGTHPTPGGMTIVVAPRDDANVLRVQELPATLAAFVVRDALSRVARNLLFVIGGVVLVFFTHTLFPFRQRTQLEALAWIYVGATFTTILTVLIQVKRNDVIGDLTSSTPDSPSSWDGAFVLRIAVFALVPLFTLFAAQFPDLGGVVLQWLEPMKGALP